MVGLKPHHQQGSHCTGEEGTMALIRTENGEYLNSENIIKFRRLRGNHYQFLDVDGGEHLHETHEPEEKFFQVIPAAAGYTAITDVGDGYFAYSPIIGWRICPGGNYALTEGSQDAEYGYEAIIAPDGTVFDGEGNKFGSLSAWQESVKDEQKAAA
jgi:hypothetical protein